MSMRIIYSKTEQSRYLVGIRVWIYIYIYIQECDYLALKRNDAMK